jgi:hypothetical protein
MKDCKLNLKEMQMVLREKFVIFKVLESINFRTICYQCGISKKQGVDPLLVTMTLFLLSFVGKSVNHFINHCKTSMFANIKKDVLYRLAKDPTINWRRFIYKISQKIIIKLKLYKSWKNRFFVIDTTNIIRSGKKSEFLSWNYDSCKKRTVTGYQITLLGLCDMNSFLPLDYSVTASKKRICNENVSVDKRTCGGLRRKEVEKTKIELSFEMLSRAVNEYGIYAKTLLVDSWFCFGSFINHVVEKIGLDVISKMKISSKIIVSYKGKRISTQNLINNILTKIQSKTIEMKSERFKVANIICKYGNQDVKLVFCVPEKKSESKQSIIVLSTDINLTEKEILTAYSSRWAIEVMFKHSKEKFQLNVKHIRTFESIICFTTLSIARYLMISYMERWNKDYRTIGDLFENVKQEIEELNIIASFEFFFSELLKTLSEKLSIKFNFMDNLMKVTESIAFSVQNLLFLRCET